jgi:heme/copper-type cytochrome/quinol oxidase subunit 2
MKNILRNRMALSTVVTTLIILVVSVLLAGVVSYFAINVTSTRVQEESLTLSYQHIWVAQSDGSAVGALMITNSGGRDVVINKIAVRGQAADWTTQVYANPNQSPTTDMNYNATLGAPYVAATGSIVVPSGTTVGVYVESPDSIGLNDIGLTAAFTVFTSQAMYYKETNIQAYVG